MPSSAVQEGATVPATDTQPSTPRTAAGQAPPLSPSLEAGLLKRFIPKSRYGAGTSGMGQTASHHILHDVCAFPTGCFMNTSSRLLSFRFAMSVIEGAPERQRVVTPAFSPSFSLRVCGMFSSTGPCP